jgi:transketolase
MSNFYKDLVIDSSLKPKATRLSFGEELAVLGEQNSDIVVLDADLSKSTRTDLFASRFPKRFYEMGIAEANMIGVAAGLALAGKIPFAASFGCFLTGRFDQIRMSVSFTEANVRLIGTHAGVAIGEDGHSQMALEDLSLMRALPNMTVFQPADDLDTREFLRWSLGHKGPCYMRLTRHNLPALKRFGSEGSAALKPGVWQWLTDPAEKNSIVVLASGGIMAPVVEAADLLNAQKSLRVGLVNANWIKPLDEALLKKLHEDNTALIVTVEDHYTSGGLGTAVAEFLADAGSKSRLLRIGVEGFGQSGSPEETMEHYGFTGHKLAAKIAKAL